MADSGDSYLARTLPRRPLAATGAIAEGPQTASVGYYKVGLQGGITTELTATARTAMARFSFPTSSRAHLVFKLSGSQQPDKTTSFHAVNRTEVRGSVRTGAFCQSGNSYTVYFDMRFSQRFAANGTFTRAGLHRGRAIWC